MLWWHHSTKHFYLLLGSKELAEEKSALKYQLTVK
jgi:hypothetical protein